MLEKMALSESVHVPGPKHRGSMASMVEAGLAWVSSRHLSFNSICLYELELFLKVLAHEGSSLSPKEAISPLL